MYSCQFVWIYRLFKASRILWKQQCITWETKSSKVVEFPLCSLAHLCLEPKDSMKEGRLSWGPHPGRKPSHMEGPLTGTSARQFLSLSYSHQAPDTQVNEILYDSSPQADKWIPVSNFLSWDIIEINHSFSVFWIYRTQEFNKYYFKSLNFRLICYIVLETGTEIMLHGV